MSPKKGENACFHLIACNTVFREFRDLIPGTCTRNIVSFTLHSNPGRLQEELQRLIDNVPEGTTHIILGFGLCSNGLAGLMSKRCHLVIPKVHDCIALFFGSQKAFAKQAEKELGTLYLTQGFIESESGECHLLEYEKYKERYGVERAREYMKQILAHYKRVALLNTGSYDLEEYEKIARDFGREFDLYYEELPGSGKLFEKLMLGKWDEEVILIPPGGKTDIFHFM